MIQSIQTYSGKNYLPQLTIYVLQWGLAFQNLDADDIILCTDKI